MLLIKIVEHRVKYDIAAIACSFDINVLNIVYRKFENFWFNFDVLYFERSFKVFVLNTDKVKTFDS